MKFRNVSPLGDVFVPGLGDVKAGAEVEVEGELAEQFAEQPGNWQKAKGAK